jgi:hypothetical protein
LATFAADGRMIALAAEKKVVLIDARAGTTLRELIAGESTIHVLAFDPDGKRVWGASISGNPLRAWDRDTGEVLQTIKAPATGIAFGFDGSRRSLLEFKGGKVIAHGLAP